MSGFTDSEEKHINELATEAASKRGAGRPEIDSEAIFNELIAKPETRKKIRDQIKYLVAERRKANVVNERYKDDVKATKEVFGLATSFINSTVDAIVKDKVDKKKSEASQFADFLQILMEDEGMEDEFDEED